jgi:hypothetical protein
LESRVHTFTLYIHISIMESSVLGKWLQGLKQLAVFLYPKIFFYF